jgi:hypothetical protein
VTASREAKADFPGEGSQLAAGTSGPEWSAEYHRAAEELEQGGSASKNFVPGGCAEREVWTALHPEFRLLSHRNSEPSAGAAAIPD